MVAEICALHIQSCIMFSRRAYIWKGIVYTKEPAFNLYFHCIRDILTNSIVSSCNVARNIYSNSKNNSTNAVCVGFDSSRYNKDFLNFLFE